MFVISQPKRYTHLHNYIAQPREWFHFKNWNNVWANNSVSACIIEITIPSNITQTTEHTALNTMIVLTFSPNKHFKSHEITSRIEEIRHRRKKATLESHFRELTRHLVSIVFQVWSQATPMIARQYGVPRPELATHITSDAVLACSGHERLIGLRMLGACPIGHTF